jgi:hypothetical protein
MVDAAKGESRRMRLACLMILPIVRVSAGGQFGSPGGAEAYPRRLGTGAPALQTHVARIQHTLGVGLRERRV